MKKFLVVLIIIALLGAGGYSGWQWWTKNKSAATEDVPQNLTAQVTRQNIESAVEVSGDIQPVLQVEVKPEISARIKTISIILGDLVKQGQILMELDDRDLLTEKESAEIEIAGAKLSLEKSVKNFERDKQLFDKQLVSKQTLTDTTISRKISENDLEKSMKRLQIVKDKLAKTRIPAPMDGMVLELPVVEGQVVVGAASVNSGTSLVRLADLNRLMISTNVNQVDVARLKAGMPVVFTVDSISDAKMHGHIKSIAPTATIVKNIKGFAVEMAIDKPDPRLKPGMTADVSIPIESVKNVLSIPLAAVFNDNKDQKIAYVKMPGEDQPPEKRVINVGLSNLDFAEVKSGLKENETVLLTRPASLKNSK